MMSTQGDLAVWSTDSQDFTSQECSTHGANRPANTASGTGGLYIVRFMEYKAVAEHKTAVQATLLGYTGAAWVDRHNPAAKYPTDFGILQLPPAVSEAAKVCDTVESC